MISARPFAIAIVIALSLAGCGDERAAAPAVETPPRDHAAGAPAAQVVPPATVAEVAAQVDAPVARAALRAWALDAGLAPALRYAALRRLEEWRAPEALAVAGELARGERSFLKDNAVALLVRQRTPAADALLAALDPEPRALARQIEEAAARGQERTP